MATPSDQPRRGNSIDRPAWTTLTPSPLRQNLPLALALVICTSPFAVADPDDEPLFRGATPGGREAREAEIERAFDRLWDAATLLDNENAAVIQQLRFVGRFHGDAVWAGSEFDDWELRRWRMGLKATLFQEFGWHVEAELDPEEDGDAYRRLTDAYLIWRPDDEFRIKLGKQSAAFTQDGHTSSNLLLTPERSNIANNLWFPEEYMPGLSLRGRTGDWLYFLGGFSGGSKNREFGEFDGSPFGIAAGAYDFAGDLDLEEGFVVLDYTYQEPDPNNTFTRPLQHVGALSLRFDTGTWGLRTDLTAGRGFGGQSDLWGFAFMPFLDITDDLQLVGRYSYLDADGTGGIRLGRYANRVTDNRGDRYHEFFLGFNYFIYGHRLKLQTGVEWAQMTDRTESADIYDGWTWVSSLRFWW